MNVLLFLGSGISLQTGLPKSNEILEQLLYGEWHGHTDELYYKGLHHNEVFRQDDWVLAIQPMLIWLREHGDCYFKDKFQKETTYEDLYFMAKQIEDECYGEVYNPAVSLFVLEMQRKFEKLGFKRIGHDEVVKMGQIARRSCHFIECVLWHLLSTDKPPTGISFLLEIAQNDQVEHLDIVTTNHDLLIERFLESNRIPYTDGFVDEDGDIKYYDRFQRDVRHRVSLLKLHGSIDWYLFERNVDQVSYACLGKTPNQDVWHARDALNQIVHNYRGRPVFLPGTYNKFVNYNYGIYFDMQSIFRERLDFNNLIIMSGYGWNDKLINHRIIEWLRSSDLNRLLIFHAYPENELRDRSRSGLYLLYDDLVSDEKLVPIRKWFQDAKISDVIPYLAE